MALFRVTLLCCLAVLASAHPGILYHVEETVPAGSRIGITAPVGSNDRVLIKTEDTGDAGVAARAEKEPTVADGTKAEKEPEVVQSTPEEVKPRASSTSSSSTSSIVAISSVSTSGQPQHQTNTAVHSASSAAASVKKQAEPRRAKVTLVGSAPGQLILEQANPEDPVRITGEVTGLTPGNHGFHIHVYGDTAENCAAAGGHFNPAQVMHGAPHADMRHVGDLGNVVADESGVARIDITDSHASLYDGVNSVVGRGVVVHAGQDDLGLGGDDGSKATGNAGGRLSCGIIGLTGPAKKKTT